MEGNHAGGADRLQDAHGGGGALDQGGDGGAYQNTQQGIGKGDEQLAEGGELLEAGDGIFHGLHSDEQKAQPQQDLAHDLPAAAPLKEHEEHDAHRCQQRAQDRGLEQGQKDVVGRNVAQPEELRGDRGADVGAHDNSHSLGQLHDAGIDEAHAHYGGGGGALNQTRDQSAKQDSLEHVAGQSFQNTLQPTAGELLQTVGHGGHAEQEGRDCTYQGDHISCVHKFPPNLTSCQS